MHGVKPDLSASDATADSMLTSSNIEAPIERAIVAETSTPTQTRSSSIEAVKRFEEIRKQELSASSFSFDKSHAIELDKHSVPNQQSLERNHSRSKPLTPARSLLGSRKRHRSLFEGLTILDKLVSFVAGLIKSLERSLLSSTRNTKTLQPLKQTQPDQTVPLEPRLSSRDRLKRRRNNYRQKI